MEGFPTLMGSSDEDFKHLWDTDLDPSMQDVLRLNSANDVEWTSYMEKDMPGVVIHDKLMTDAVLGTRPIKTEHSYSLASDGDSLPDSPISHHHKLDDMEDECFPVMPLNKACERIRSEEVTIKDEPNSETDSPHSSCPSSPQSSFMNTSELHFDVDMKNATTQSLLKQANLLISSAPAHTILPQNNNTSRLPHHSHVTNTSTSKSQHQQITSKFNLKFDTSSSSTTTNSGGQLHHLPPTPPSCSSGSEDSEDNATCFSRPPSPSPRKNGGGMSATSTRVILSHHHHHSSTRQPIHTPLISSQPKGSTGTLILTEEEKRTLIAEGYSVPTRLPLTKTEEKSLKKIRRKIKNKISAQESRRKKKEYMDQLERKVEILVSENNDFRSKIDSLEDSNSNLLSQLQKLQAIVARTHPQLMKNLK